MKNYLKKIGIMFVMTLMLSLGFCFSAFAADASWKTYDNVNTNFTYENLYDWHNGDTTNLYNGGAHTVKDISSKSSAKFNFIGTQFKLNSQTYVDGRNKNIDVYIDGKLYNFSAAQVFVHGYPTIFQSPELAYGEHTVSIEKGVPYKEGYIWFDQVQIYGELLAYDESINKDKSINIDKSTMNLTVGDIQQLTATTTPAGVGVSWTSSDISIATVDSTGKVTAGSIAGTCTITATTNDGSNLSASCIVTVTPKAIEPIPNPTPTPTPNQDLEYIVNTAHAKGDNTNNAGGGVSIIYMGLAEAQLSVVKTADVSAVYVGDNFTYTIVVTNTSSKPAKAVVVKDSAPNHIQFIVSGITTTQGNVDSSSTSSNVAVNVGDIPALGTVTIKIPATVIL